MLFEQTPEEYLKTVDGWDDPNPFPLILDHDGFMVVRDDLLGIGSKARFIDCLVKTNSGKEWVFGGSNPVGWGPISLTHVCNIYGKKATFFMAARKTPTPQQQKVLELGGNIIWVKMGMLTVTLSRARKYYEEDPINRRILPLGLDHPMVIGSIIKVARSITFINPITEVWTAASGGVLSRGLQLAFPNLPVHAVQIGHNLTERELGRATRWVSPYRFDQPIKDQEAPPFPSAKEYDSKIWPFIKKYGKPNSLLWNVA